MTTTVESPNSTAVAAPANNGPAPAAHMVQLTGRTGKVLGERYVFTGQHTAKELRELHRSRGLKGNELTKAVNESLEGKRDVSLILLAAHNAAMVQAGYIPNFTDLKAKSAITRWVKPVEPKASVSKVEKQIAEFTPEERAELIAKLTAGAAAK